MTVKVNKMYEAVNPVSGEVITDGRTKKELNKRLINQVLKTYGTLEFYVREVITYEHPAK